LARYTRAKANPVEGNHLLYGFLTIEPYDVIGPVSTSKQCR
jgi:hypothetical protein